MKKIDVSELVIGIGCNRNVVIESNKPVVGDYRLFLKVDPKFSLKGYYIDVLTGDKFLSVLREKSYITFVKNVNNGLVETYNWAKEKDVKLDINKTDAETIKGIAKIISIEYNPNNKEMYNDIKNSYLF